ncbi:MAG: response regulator [Myxococcales bacterium]|nr:MAG: response regulator [Myxococcales bacterium]
MEQEISAPISELAPVKQQLPRMVVGIGASAGGLEALEAFFEQVPIDSGMAFVVVQHLSPDFRSLMDEILARRTNLPVHLVEDGVTVEPDRIYLIPAKKEMIIAQGRLLLSDRGHDQELSLPIDVFFRSLAQDCESRAVAVVLSGGGSDGSRGICDVHDAGGLVLVQDPDSAQFDGMPRTSRDAGVADAILPPQEMPRFLLSHGSDPSSRRSSAEAGDHGMTAVYRMLEKEYGIDFTHYKPSTVTRRIERRLQLSRAENIDDYVKRLRSEREEMDVLYRDLLIGVTRFFRNEEAFSLMEQRVLPELWQSLPKGAPLRVWVTGCATGEEVYSLAILLFELGQQLGERPIKIFATDVHRGSLEVATRALYDEQAVAGVSPERLERHFLRRGHSYQVSPELRQMVVFAQHNVIKDAPFTRVHLVSCRNMLIYLQPAVQQRVLSLFHFALTLGGVMFLGPSESPGTLVHDFSTVDKHWRIYKKASESRMPVDTRPQLSPRSQRQPSAPALRATSTPPRYSAPQLLGVYDTLLAEMMPPSLLINDVGELVHVFGGASKFLRLQEGRQGLNVLDLVDGELKTVLAGGLKRALKLATPLTFRSVHVLDGASSGHYKVTVRPMRVPSVGVPHFLISFEVNELDSDPKTPPTEVDVGEVSREQLALLEAELKYTKENLQTATEEVETSNEELQAANEELLASNEELQSTNEELQSVNEELYSVNAEYQRKISDLTELANDMENLLASTDIGTVFLDAQLRIRNFTARAAEIFHLLPHDIGRPIENLTHSMDYPELAGDFRKVLANGTPIEKELRGGKERVFFARILPYRAKGAVDGVVLTLVDVSSLKLAEDQLFHERYLLNSLLASVPDAIYFKDARGRFIRANHALAARLGLADPRQAVGKTGFELPGYQNALSVHQQDDVVLRSGAAQHYELERRDGPDGHEAWDLVTRLPLNDAGGNIVGIIGIFRDVTAQKRSEQRIVEAVARRDQFLAMLSHELRNPLGAMVTAAQLLEAQGEDAPTERRRRLLDVLMRQSKQMARLLDDLLEASRVTQDKIELRKRTVDIRPIVSESVDAARELMQTRQIELELHLGERPIVVDCDPARLQQILANLLNNAAKYTPIGGHVQVRAEVSGNMAVLRVKDDGMGIPKDTLAEVFELFVQSTRTLDRAEGGLGVGLTLVRGLVERHGGSVEAHSDGAGQGSEFIARLPLSTDSPASISDSPEAKPMFNSDLPPLKVVIVEDNDDSRMMLCELLELSGFECHTASTGRLGVDVITELTPDVALVDIGLPELDGLEVAKLLRQDPKLEKLLLIALTGYGQREDREAARRAGFDTHLVKPVDFDALLGLLRAHAAKRTRAEPSLADTLPAT